LGIAATEAIAALATTPAQILISSPLHLRDRCCKEKVDDGFNTQLDCLVDHRVDHGNEGV
jgi:hypothetical protein